MTISQPPKMQPLQMPNMGGAPPWSNKEDKIDVNLIAMLLWQALLTGTAVAVSHLAWYLPNSSPGEMGLQYGLVTFGFLCASMVLFHVGGIRDSLSMRAEFSQEGRYDKWIHNQMRHAQRRMSRQQYYTELQGEVKQIYGQDGTELFGLPNDNTQIDDGSSNDQLQ